MNYKKSAEEILEAIGGEDNLDAMAHCATRLRLVLNDESKVDEDTLSKMDVVKGTFSTGGQYQIIIGSVQSIKYLMNLKNNRERGFYNSGC